MKIRHFFNIKIPRCTERWNPLAPNLSPYNVGGSLHGAEYARGSNVGYQCFHRCMHKRWRGANIWMYKVCCCKCKVCVRSGCCRHCVDARSRTCRNIRSNIVEVAVRPVVKCTAICRNKIISDHLWCHLRRWQTFIGFLLNNSTSEKNIKHCANVLHHMI